MSSVSDVTTETLTLADFLLARIAGDEAVARKSACPCDDPGCTRGLDTNERVELWSPARVLAECEAKRRIVGAAQDYSGELEYGDNGEYAFGIVLAHLALPYADHPEYRKEWRP